MTGIRDRDALDLSTPDAFVQVFDVHHRPLHRYLARRVGAHTADDLAAETFLVAYRRRHDFRPDEGSVRAWLYGIATNLAHGAAARAALLAEADAAPVAGRRGRWLLAAAVVVVLVVVSVTVFGGSGGATAQAADVLGRSATRTLTVTDPVVAPGQFRYVETHSWYGTAGVNYEYLREEVHQLWVPADADQEWTQIRTTTGNVRWISGDRAGVPVDPPASETLRAPRGEFYGPVEGGWQTPDPAFLASLPRDPAALYGRLSADAPDTAGVTPRSSSTPPTRCARAWCPPTSARRSTGR